jgi:hypothetical protein
LTQHSDRQKVFHILSIYCITNKPVLKSAVLMQTMHTLPVFDPRVHCS